MPWRRRSRVSQSTRPIQRSRFSAYQRIVLQDALLPAHLRLPAGLAVQLLVADAERHHLARARAVARVGRDDVPAGRPEAVLLADADDQSPTSRAIEMFSPWP